MQVEVDTATELYPGLLKKCLTRLAFEDSVTEPITAIDWTGVFWQRQE